jgi:hypothetical protein
MDVFSKHIIVNPRPSGKQGREFAGKKEGNTEKTQAQGTNREKMW